jgi:hypothetical protein
MRVPRSTPHIRIDRGGSSGQGDEWGGIIVAVIVFVMIIALLA